MVLSQTIVTMANSSVAQSMYAMPLQLSGDFLYWAVVFFVLAIIAGAVGASGVAGITMTVAKWFVIIFIVLAVISLLL